MFKKLFLTEFPEEGNFDSLRILLKVVNAKPGIAALNFGRVVIFFAHVESNETDKNSILSVSYEEKGDKISISAVGQDEFHLRTETVPAGADPDDFSDIDYRWLNFGELIKRFSKNTADVGVVYLVDKPPQNLQELSQLTAKIEKDPKAFARLNHLVRFTPELTLF